MSARLHVRGRMIGAALLALLPASLFGPAAAAITLRDVQTLVYSPAPAATLPATARFVDEQGRNVALGEFFAAHAAIVVPGYYGCSSLCATVMQSLAAALQQARLEPGRDVEVVAVSIAPLETPAVARARMSALLGPGAHPGWHFLTGREAAIDALAGALGYRAVFDAASDAYAHPTGVAVVAAGGKVRRVLKGIAFSPPELRAALAPPTDAAPAPSLPRRWLLCFHDAIAAGQYDDRVARAMQLGGLGVIAGLGMVVLAAARKTRTRRTVP
jgi:protein SCO1/2